MRLTAVIVAVLALAAPASGATFAVDATSDTHDKVVGDGQCKDAGGKCTLRAALEESNGLTGADTITVPAGTYTSTTEMVITSAMTVRGAGARATILDGPAVGAVLDVFNAGDATLSGLALTGAAEGLHVRDGGRVDGQGITIRDNVPPDPMNSYNAGLFVSGSQVTLEDSSIVDNVGGGSSPILGGGVYNGGGTVVLRRTTIAGNAGAPGRQTLGGGVFTTMGSLTLDHVTVAGNTATGGQGDDLYSIAAPATVRDSIVGECAGLAPTAQGADLGADASCGFALVGDPLLGVLGDHGGPTDTRLPGPGSPAVDAAGTCAGPDQRGVPAPAGAACDIGAVEVAAGRSVTLQASAGEAAAGGAVTLIATAVNGGPDDSQGTTIGFDLPAGASADLINSPSGTCTGTSCSFGALPKDGKATVTLALRLPSTAGPATTIARVSGATPDPSAADDTASITTTVVGPAPAPTATATPQPTADRTAPVLTRVRLVSRRKLAFTVSEAATVRVAIRRRGKAAGNVTRRVTKGAHRLRLPSRRGRLRLFVTATDAAGNRSATRRVTVRARK